MPKELDTRGVLSRISRVREAANLLLQAELAARGFDQILPAHGAILVFLFQQEEPVAMKEIVAQIGRVKSTVTGMVSTLERAGYVKRTPCPQDGRVVRVALTEKGQALRAPFIEISEWLQARIYRQMPAADRQELNRLLEQLLSNLEGDGAGLL